MEKNEKQHSMSIKKRKEKKGILKEKPEPIVPLTSMPLEKTQKIKREEKTDIVE